MCLGVEKHSCLLVSVRAHGSTIFADRVNAQAQSTKLVLRLPFCSLVRKLKHTSFVPQQLQANWPDFSICYASALCVIPAIECIKKLKLETVTRDQKMIYILFVLVSTNFGSSNSITLPPCARPKALSDASIGFKSFTCACYSRPIPKYPSPRQV